MDEIERILKIIAALVAVTVPVILLAGYSYHLGYVMTFGLNVELIPKRLPDMLVESWYVGIIAMAWLLSKWPFFLVLFITFCLYCFALFLFLLRAKNRGNTWLFEELTKENQGKKILGFTQWHWVMLGQLFRTTFQWLFAPFVLIAIIALFTAKPYQHGQAQATKQIEAYVKTGCDRDNKVLSCVYLFETATQPNQMLTKGILVTANQERIAIFNGKLEVRPLLESIIIRKHKIDD